MIWNETVQYFELLVWKNWGIISQKPKVRILISWQGFKPCTSKMQGQRKEHKFYLLWAYLNVNERRKKMMQKIT
jgi:hypothetical protein